MIFFTDTETDAELKREEDKLKDAMLDAMSKKLEEWGERYEAAEDRGDDAERSRIAERILAIEEIGNAAGYYIECGLWGWTIEKTKESE